MRERPIGAANRTPKRIQQTRFTCFSEKAPNHPRRWLSWRAAISVESTIYSAGGSSYTDIRTWNSSGSQQVPEGYDLNDSKESYSHSEDLNSRCIHHPACGP